MARRTLPKIYVVTVSDECVEGGHYNVGFPSMAQAQDWHESYARTNAYSSLRSSGGPSFEPLAWNQIPYDIREHMLSLYFNRHNLFEIDLKELEALYEAKATLNTLRNTL